MDPSHRKPWLLACAIMLVPTALAMAANPPKTVGEIYDGTLHDIAAAPGKVWLAQGRMVTMLDPSTGKRIGDDRLSPYPSGVMAVEHDPTTGDLVVATGEHAEFFLFTFQVDLQFHHGAVVDRHSTGATGHAIDFVAGPFVAFRAEQPGSKNHQRLLFHAFLCQCPQFL